MKKKRSNNRAGFTLVEIIVTLVVMGILAALIVPVGLGYIDKKREEQCELNRRSLLAYWESDRIMENAELADTITKYANGTKEITCPSGGIYAEAPGNHVECSVHHGKLEGFEQAQIETTKVPVPTTPPLVSTETPDSDSGEVTITGADDWDAIVEDSHKSKTPIEKGVYVESHNSKGTTYVYVFRAIIADNNGYNAHNQTPGDLFENNGGEPFAVALDRPPVYYTDANCPNTITPGKLYKSGNTWYVCIKETTSKPSTDGKDNAEWVVAVGAEKITAVNK